VNAGRRVAQRAQYSASTGLHSSPVSNCSVSDDLGLLLLCFEQLLQSVVNTVA